MAQMDREQRDLVDAADEDFKGLEDSKNYAIRFEKQRAIEQVRYTLSFEMKFPRTLLKKDRLYMNFLSGSFTTAKVGYISNNRGSDLPFLRKETTTDDSPHSAASAI